MARRNIPAIPVKIQNNVVLPRLNLLSKSLVLRLKDGIEPEEISLDNQPDSVAAGL
jgi:hypothetical protein